MERLRPRATGRRWIPVAVGLIAVAATAMFVWAMVRVGRSGAGSELAELVAAVGPNRPFEARLAGFKYGSPVPPARTGSAAVAAAAPDVRIAVARIEKAAAEHRTPRMLAALGAANLISGKPVEAVEALESAVRDEPSNSVAWNDLAAAYLVRAEHGRRPEDLVKALAAADRATRAAPALEEAWFNRALAIGEIGGLREEARRSWQTYTKIDEGSEWTAEAMRHLEALSIAPERTWPELKPGLSDAVTRGDRASIVETARKFPARVREYLFGELLPAWGAAFESGAHDEATVALRHARSVADALLTATSDAMAKDVVDGIDRARRDQLREIATGVVAFGRAARLADERQIDRSQSLFESAATTLERTGNPLFAEALNGQAAGPISTARYEEAAAAMERLAAFAEHHRYPLLIGRVRWGLGLIAVARADLGRSLVEYRAALSAYEAAGEREFAVRVRNVLAENLRLLGQLRESWVEQRQALITLDRIADVGGRAVILGSAANACLRGELPNAALVFFDAMVAEAESSAQPGQIVGARLRRARASWRIGDMEAAARDLEAARAWLGRMNDAASARTRELEILAQEGEAFQRERPDRAIRALDAAIDGYKQRRVPQGMPILFLTRGRAHLSQGKFEAAEQDFLTGIDLFEEEHRRIEQRDVRASHFDEAWDLFAEMIAVQAGPKRRPDLALGFAERAHARTLAEAVSGAAALPPPDIFDARVRAPLADTAVVCYLSLADRLLAWVLTDARADFFELPIARSRIASLIEAHRTRVVGGTGAAILDAEAGRLYDAVIQPLVSSLKGRRHVVFVPDGPLHAVPFAALKDPRSRRYLVEDHAIGVAPSLALLLGSMHRTRATSAAVTDALVVGDPQLDRTVVGELPTLAEAKAEAQDVAKLYPQALLLTGEAASKQRFLETLNEHEVVHFAGHAVQNAEFPWLSRLLLAADSAGNDSGTLFAYELAARRLERVRLVVLGACATAAGPALRGEGVLNLARPFLAAGVPSVVATLWDVDDRGGRRLLTAFHRYVRAAESPIVALRHAQLDLLHGADPSLQAPGIWANFVIIGAPGVTAPGHQALSSHN